MSTGLCSTFSFIQFCSDSGKVLYIVITVWAQMSKSMARKFVSISFSLLTLWRLSMDWQQGGDDTPCEWFSGGGWSLSAHGMAWWVIPLPSQPLFNLRLPPSHCQNWGNSVTTKKTEYSDIWHIIHSIHIFREALDLTLSILPCLQGRMKGRAKSSFYWFSHWSRCNDGSNQL